MTDAIMACISLAAGHRSAVSKHRIQHAWALVVSHKRGAVPNMVAMVAVGVGLQHGKS
jgi:hypothetical protein